ncbi:wax ester/triacylglycerol synthase domain-containing protein [Mycobacterium sp.]|uniref:wax ester/triacylglycerol synthase domain-containing protein n=1 Tax=Mycobacterium sp. TaxID=1785 RepID=UPI003F9836F9
MEHLSTLDAGFLETEDSDPHVSLAIGTVSVIEGPIPEYDSLVSGLTERVVTVPRFRQVLRMHPLDLEAPERVDAENFDISHHLHRVALPHPGDRTDDCRAGTDPITLPRQVFAHEQPSPQTRVTGVVVPTVCRRRAARELRRVAARLDSAIGPRSAALDGSATRLGPTAGCATASGC